MSKIKSMMLAFALLSPAVSYAFPVGSIKADDTVKEHQRKVANYAAGQNKVLPEIIEYEYGMKLDIVQVILLAPDPRACKVIPQLMTYEDSAGELKTLRYPILSDCRSKN
ncbi:MAG TPA: DUF2790 domain-containing protein [Pseudomonas sp.]|jgi:hypothetical protein|uniref:DUF2790 domain-containing protein n=1 Tax=Pseudomonas sp. TaxID=306 RepID=UPI002ED8C936